VQALKNNNIWQEENQRVQRKQDPRKLQLEEREVKKVAALQRQLKEGGPAKEKHLLVLQHLMP
jgi:hypothetical protein